MFDLEIIAKGDLEVDYHHLVEDVGITLGDALLTSLGNRAGIFRYGSGEAPLDEALVKVVLDFSGRPFLSYGQELKNRRIRDFDVQLMEEFARAFCDRGRITMHVIQESGKNNHHILEAAFKAMGLALRKGCEQDPRRGGEVPSTKGSLTV